MRLAARFSATLILFLASGGALLGAPFAFRQEWIKEVSLAEGGIVWIANPTGNIDVIGVEGSTVSILAERLTRGADAAAVDEAKEQTAIYVAGDERNRTIRTLVPMVHSVRWTTNVNYSVRVPTTANLRIESSSSDHIRISNVRGSISVKNLNGAIFLDNATGPVTVDSVNGTIVYDPNGNPSANVSLTTVNGQIQVAVMPDARFQWVAETIKGDFLTNLPIRGRVVGTGYRGALNAGGPILATAAMTGNVTLLRKGSRPNDARSVRAVEGTIGPVTVARTIDLASFDGNFAYSTNVGNIRVGQVRGNAKVETGAGEVHLGRILGGATVRSGGGPLEIGDVIGAVNAYTKAGDVLVQAARGGGEISTDGGLIRVLYAGAPGTRLHSGGGDIIVRQASGPVNADTRSGDITINVDAGLLTTSVTAKTSQGSIVLNVAPKFSADIDATLVTSDADAHTIRSDFAGLQIRREPAGNNRMRIHATGKINGGGERVELYAEEGDILLTAQPMRPVMLVGP
ncbi:MAG TPA: DUF4097 family beta strand repeat-containing protein [Thermoanaerobaculia bacterium]|jgi:DUF4097 and DUF4098 domain-containing protein YvlB|nr:DUF4097 family beta strand repeat-containing protein [Thermoanaerobaculia bacterium]